MPKRIHVSIALPTYSGGESLIHTLKSIYSQSAYKKLHHILVVVDGKKLSKKIRLEIQNPKLLIKYYPKRRGQAVRINNIFDLLFDDLIILTNDDVLLDRNVVENIIQTFQKTKADLIGCNVQPLSFSNVFTKALFTGQMVHKYIAHNWNRGNNYFTCNGRLIAVSRNLAKKIEIPKGAVNNDAFIYIFTKLHKFKYAFAKQAICYYKLPGNFSEHLQQNNRFQNSLKENKAYFSKQIYSIYNFPKSLALKSFAKSFVAHPLSTLLYIQILLKTMKLNLTSKKFRKKAIWKTDISTKTFNKSLLVK